MIADEKVMCYVLYKMRTISEVRDKCQRLKLSPEYTDEVIDYLIEAGYLDDKRYAKKYIENAMRLKNASRNELKIDLLKHGIDPSLAEESVEQEGLIEFEEKSCEVVAQKKYKSTPDILKVKKFLIGKGYSFEAISKAIDNLKSLYDN